MNRALLLFLALLNVGAVRSQSVESGPEGIPVERPTAYAKRISVPPVLDGIVDEAVWAEIEPASGFVQQNPDEGAAATEQTEVRIAFDDTYLYFGVICFDSQPENIVITQNRRDGELENTDSIQILLDTFNDGQNGFVFATTPTGIEYDGQLSKAGQARGGVGGPARAGGGGGAQRGGAAAFNLNWDAVWDVRAQITKRGWETEIRIPFRTLRYRPGSGAWGLNIERNLRRRNEQTFWAPLSRAFLFSQVELAGALEGLETTTQRNLKLLPYVLAASLRTSSASRTRPSWRSTPGST